MLDRFTGYKRLLALAALNGGGASIIERTATGNPLTFLTDLAKPLKSLVANFLPVQASGTPSPDNILPITGWTGVNVSHGGKNLFKTTAQSKTASDVTFTVNSDGTVTVSGIPSGYVDLTLGECAIPNKGKIVLSGLESASKIRWSMIRLIDSNDNVLVDFYGSATVRPFVIDLSNYPTATKMRIGIKREDNNVEVSGTVKPMIEIGETASEYEAYKPITEHEVTFDSPVYGGTLDVVSGVLTVEWAGFSAKWKDGINADNRGTVTRKTFTLSFTAVSPTSSAQGYCNVAGWKWNFESDDTHFYTNGTNAYVFLPNDTDGETNIQIVGKLATPQEIQLTPAQITALVGDNTIWSDADGSMTAVYLLTESFGDDHPISGGLGSGLLGGGFGSGSGEPDEPVEPDDDTGDDQPADDQPEEP